ncbi:MAG: right-handed parallel beta-helix repeat-containing protein [Spirochaetota bacterium]|nr:right-handed parallel beta-helix repeat-containing protein [Spirochaetota bacterium]
MRNRIEEKISLSYDILKRKSIHLLLIIIFSLSSIGWICSGNSGSGDIELYPPEPPSNPQALSISSSRVDITWNDNSNNEVGFTLERALDNGGNPGIFSDIANVSANIDFYSDINLSAEATYYYRVKAYNNAGISVCYDIASATTSDTPPDTPPVPEVDYYVNQNHPEADDSNPGTEDLPFRTISAALSQSTAGDLVLVKAGTYDEALTIPSGDSGNDFTLMGAPDERIIVSIAQNPIINCNNVKNVCIEGFEISGASGNGINISDSDNIVIKKCAIYDNSGDLRAGININSSTNVTISQNFICRNWYGISMSYATGVTIEKNDIGYNIDDGMRITWNSNDITVKQNYIHHHMIWDEDNSYDIHPDNIQIFRYVNNISFIENLLIGAGQNIMMEQIWDGEIIRNTIIGSISYSVVFGHSYARDFIISENTITFSRYGSFLITDNGYDVYENVLMNGHQDTAIKFESNLDGYNADRNLFYNYENPISDDIMWLSAGGGWMTLAEFQDNTAQDLSSIYTDPEFINAPVYYTIVDISQVRNCTRSTLYILDFDTPMFNVGDIIEVNFDGIPRTVTNITSNTINTITFEPELDEPPMWNAFIMNWKDNSNLVWDLRLRNGSPGENLASDDGPVGSTININEYMNGDFDGDGIRDIPISPFD